MFFRPEDIWVYAGIFGFLLACGFGFPVPEEIPIILGGIAVSKAWDDPESTLFWWVMIPVIILGVVLSDLTLYMIGRYGGGWILRHKWIEQRLLPPEKRGKIEDNFHKHGIRILLFARLLPGLRGAIFVTAGMMRVPLRHFWIADGIYAIPGVNLIFWLAYWFTDQFKTTVEKIENQGRTVVLVLLCGVTIYLIWTFIRRRNETGDPQELPPGVRQMAQIPLPLVHDQQGIDAAFTAERPPIPAKPSLPLAEDPPSQVPEPGAMMPPDIGIGG